MTRLNPIIGVKQCDPRFGGCSLVKPIEEFYFTGPGKKWRKAICRDCDNARPRPVTVTKIIRNRARHRAAQRLVEMFPVEFTALMEQELISAAKEHAILQAIGAEEAHYDVPVRLKPGRRREGQEPEHRIDTAKCRRCHITHDRGHRCPNCGHTEEEA